MKNTLIVCIPVSAAPDFKTEYSVYEKVPCPDCGEEMWLGERSKVMRDQGIHATCAYCAHFKFRVTKEAVNSLKKLTDFDKES